MPQPFDFQFLKNVYEELLKIQLNVFGLPQQIIKLFKFSTTRNIFNYILESDNVILKRNLEYGLVKQRRRSYFYFLKLMYRYKLGIQKVATPSDLK